MPSGMPIAAVPTTVERSRSNDLILYEAAPTKRMHRLQSRPPHCKKIIGLTLLDVVLLSGFVVRAGLSINAMRSMRSSNELRACLGRLLQKKIDVPKYVS